MFSTLLFYIQVHSFHIQISRKQKMKADMGCLLALCDKSENDIRSCVNTLQASPSLLINLFF